MENNHYNFYGYGIFTKIGLVKNYNHRWHHSLPAPAGNIALKGAHP